MAYIRCGYDITKLTDYQICNADLQPFPASAVTRTMSYGTNASQIQQLDGIIFGNAYTKFSGLFSSYYAWGYVNYPVIVGPNVTDCDFMFNNGQYYNQPFNIPPLVENCWGMFNNCRNLNSPIVFQGNNVVFCNNMFENCVNFNQSIVIPNSVQYAANMFYSCANLSNQTITIQSNLIRHPYRMFAGCTKLNNSEIIIPEDMNCQEMFTYCNLTRLPTFPSSVNNCYNMFTYCNINIDGQTIYLPTSNNYTNMFANATRSYCFNNTVFYIKPLDTASVSNFYRMNNSSIYRSSNITIYTNNATKFQTQWTTTYSWSALTEEDGFYNAAYRVYIYNNYI